MKCNINRRLFIATAAGAGAGLILPGRTIASPRLQPSILPIGTIVNSMDSTYGGVPHYRILCDGDYWLPLWIKNYFVQVKQFPILFSMIGYSYGRRDIHNSVYGPAGEFALPHFVAPEHADLSYTGAPVCHPAAHWVPRDHGHGVSPAVCSVCGRSAFENMQLPDFVTLPQSV